MILSLAFGRALMRLREARKLSVEILAQRSGVPLSRTTGLEKGAREPHLKDLLHLSTALGIQPSEFMRRVEREQHKVAHA